MKAIKVSLLLAAMTLTSAFAGPYVSAIEMSGPTVFYQLLETSGSTAVNSISPGVKDSTYNAGVLLNQAGPTFVGTSDPSISFVSDSGALSGSGLTSNWTPFSVEFLVKTNNPGNGATFANVGGTNMYIGGNGNFFLSTDDVYGSGVAIAFNTWTQVALTWELTDLLAPKPFTLRAYINGVEVIERLESDRNTYLTGDFVFGNVAGRDPFAGNIADISIYNNRTLSGAEIATHYAALNAVPEPSTVILMSVGFLAFAAARKWKTRGTVKVS